jgi:hypothetical protein
VFLNMLTSSEGCFGGNFLFGLEESLAPAYREIGANSPSPLPDQYLVQFLDNEKAHGKCEQLQPFLQ